MIFQQGAFQLNPNMTPEEIARKREFLHYTAPRYGDADTVGEGLGQLFTGIAHGVQRRRLGDIERKGREKATSLFESLIGGGSSTPSAADGPMTMIGVPPNDDVSMFNASLARTESGGNYTARNSEGYSGKYQFGQERLNDFNRANGTQFTTDDLVAGTPQAAALSEQVQRWHVADIDAFIDENGLLKDGLLIHGAPMNRNALRAMAHLGGKGGMKRFIQTGGQYNPADSNGTSLADYARTHGGGGGPDVSGLQAALANPWLTPQQKSIIESRIQQAQQANDPLRQLQIQKAQLDIQNAQDPQQFRQVTGDEAAAMGLDPSQVYNISPENKVAPVSGGGVTVNNNMGGAEPDRYIYAEDAGLPKGWRFDRTTQRAERIPGGPEDVEQQEAEEKSATKTTQGQLKLGDNLTNLQLNIDEIENGGLPVTGPVGDLRRTWLGRGLTGSDAYDFQNRTAKIKDSAAFAEIQNMRDNSPTGGAVGQLTDKEREAIGNAVTALNSSTSGEEYLRAAKAYRELALNIAYGEGRWTATKDGGVRAVGDEPSGPNPFANSTAQDLLSADIESMTPEEARAWEARMDELGL